MTYDSIDDDSMKESQLSERRLVHPPFVGSSISNSFHWFVDVVVVDYNHPHCQSWLLMITFKNYSLDYLMII